MALNLTPPDIADLKPRITVCGVGGAGGNAVNNMITAGLQGVDFLVSPCDEQCPRAFDRDPGLFGVVAEQVVGPSRRAGHVWHQGWL